MKPVIGISANYHFESEEHCLRDYYVAAVREAGGTAIILPIGDGDELINEYLSLCQGLILSGGGDLDPSFFGELPAPELGEINPGRDSFELALVKRAIELNLPLLGICRGCQVINVATGGSLSQHISSRLGHMQKAPRNYPFHAILIASGTRLNLALNQEHSRVNSFHHQAVSQTGRGIIVTARAPDGTVEAIESQEHNFVLGVQWHPESLTDEASHRLFISLVAAALKYRYI